MSVPVSAPHPFVRLYHDGEEKHPAHLCRWELLSASLGVGLTRQGYSPSKYALGMKWRFLPLFSSELVWAPHGT